jgi:hypothetical protein
MPGSCAVKRIAACLVSTLLSACNLGGGSNSLFSSSSSSSGGSSSGGNAGPEGIWTGVDSVSNQPMVGIVEASGVFDFIRNDGVQFVGQAVVSGTSITANDEGFAQIGGATFANNATYGTGSFSGTVATGTSITVSTTFTPLGGTMTTGTWSLTFDTLYDSGSSFAMIGGTYKNASSGPNANASVTVSSSGVLYGQGATSGCVLNGQVSLVNPTYDAYHVRRRAAAHAAIIRFSRSARLRTRAPARPAIHASSHQRNAPPPPPLLALGLALLPALASAPGSTLSATGPLMD